MRLLSRRIESGSYLEPEVPWYDGVIFALVMGAALVAGLWSLQSIPFYQPWWGLDFQNMYIYHQCSAARDLGIYVATGAECGDVKGRGFIYPPLMFHLFDWVKPFSFREAQTVWVGTMGTLMVLAGGVWAWFDGRFEKSWRFGALVGFWLLLLAQVPFVFAMERGNNDTMPVVLWTIAAALFASSKYRLAGAAIGLAVASKLYPVIALGVVAVGMVRMGWRVILPIVVGGAAAAMAMFALWPSETARYLTVLAPSVAGTVKTLDAFSHPLRALPAASALHFALTATLIGSWAVASWRRLAQEPLVIFAGALAIATYLNGISWDYNLITAYPLLLLVTARGLAPGGHVAWKVASLSSVVAIAAGRGMFTPSGQLLTQLACLIGIAWLVASDIGQVEEPRGLEPTLTEPGLD